MYLFAYFILAGASSLLLHAGFLAAGEQAYSRVVVPGFLTATAFLLRSLGL